MSKALEKKKQVVAEIAEKLKNSKSTVLTDYRGLSVSEMNELRKQLREAGVEYEVTEKHPDPPCHRGDGSERVGPTPDGADGDRLQRGGCRRSGQDPASILQGS